MTDVSSHSEFRHEDYFFQRTQSRALFDLEWEDRIPALKAWGNYIAAAVAVTLLSLLALGWR